MNKRCEEHKLYLQAQHVQDNVFIYTCKLGCWYNEKEWKELGDEYMKDREFLLEIYSYCQSYIKHDGDRIREFDELYNGRDKQKLKEIDYQRYCMRKYHLNEIKQMILKYLKGDE